MSKINLDSVGKVAGGLFKITAGIGLLLFAAERVSDEKVNVVKDSKVTYSDVIDTIMKDSYMTGSTKKEAIALVPHNADEEIYKSIIAVMNNYYMTGSTKVETIKVLCEK